MALPHLAQVFLKRESTEPKITFTLSMESRDCVGTLLTDDLLLAGFTQVTLTTGLTRLAPLHVVTVSTVAGGKTYSVSFKLLGLDLVTGGRIVNHLYDGDLTWTYQFHVDDGRGREAPLNFTLGPEPNQVAIWLPDGDTRNAALRRPEGDTVVDWSHEIVAADRRMTVTLREPLGGDPLPSLTALARMITFV